MLDAATGQVRFKRPWSAAGQYTGMGVGNPAIVGEVMVSMEGWGTETELVAFDVHSGAELWRIGVPPETFSPSPCEKLVCSTQNPSGDEVQVARDPATGTPVWTSTGRTTSRVDTDGMQVDLQHGAPVLSLFDPADGTTRWQTDLRETLGTRATTNGGWNIDQIADVVITSVWDLDHIANTVGVDRSTGTVRWTRRGLGLCPASSKTNVLLCLKAIDGGVVFRIDPLTGDVIWSVDKLAVADDALAPELAVATSGSTLFGMDMSNHPIRIDVATGARSTPKPGDLAWLSTWGELVDVHRSTSSGFSAVDQFAPDRTPVPWDPVTNAAATNVPSASDVPASVGLDLAGFRIFTDAAGTVRALHV